MTRPPAKNAGPGSVPQPRSRNSGRLLPGEGELPLAEYWKALPEGHHVSVEVPLARTRHPSFEERAKTVMDGFRAFCDSSDVPFKFAGAA